MELKTKITADEGKNDLTITREFDLPLELLFRAHVEPQIIEQWMGTKVLKLDYKKHGSWQFETLGPKGNVVFSANGVVHDFVPNRKITRTFEMDNVPFDVQLEFLEFEELTQDTSKITIHTVYRSVELRDKMLQLPFKQGINMAHNRLQEVASKFK